MGKPVQSKAWSTETLDAGIRHVNKDTDLGYIAAEEERIRKELEETHACKYDTCHEHFVYTHTHILSFGKELERETLGSPSGVVPLDPWPLKTFHLMQQHALQSANLCLRSP